MNKTVVLLSLLSIFSVACSKNKPHDSSEHQAEAPVVKKAHKAANSDDCFKLEPNKQFTLNNNEETEIQIVPTTFNNQNAIAIVRQGAGVRTDYIYDLTGRTMLANLDYGIAALGSNPNDVLVKTTYQAPLPTFPSNLKPQQKFQMTYNAVIESQMDNNDKSENNKTIDLVFVGFEDLTLIDNDDNTLKFDNACHFISQIGDETLDEWYAEGYGQIKYVKKKQNGDVKSSEAIGDDPLP
ncbi:hypothetical protein ACNPQK_08145 [Acinetobacter guillouiae]|uniref:hypothetical protein n=1 Tax=Acinetobacter guillouiae TaxID=106649 RepID=UPI003AF51EC2